MSIARDSKIGDVVKQHPGAARVMMSYGLHCVGCHVAFWETIEQGCQGHGMPDDMIDDMIDELNELAKEEKQGVPERSGKGPQGRR